MASETSRAVDTGIDTGAWRLGTVGGIVAAAVMAAAIVVMNPPTIEAAIPALYTLSGGAAGVTVHLAHGAVLGVAFAGLLCVLPVDSPGATVAAGLAWGAVTWVLLAALLMPVWLGTVGFGGAPPFPNFAVPSLLWHLLYGAVLGAVFVAGR